MGFRDLEGGYSLGRGWKFRKGVEGLGVWEGIRISWRLGSGKGGVQEGAWGSWKGLGIHEGVERRLGVREGWV